MKHLFFLLFFLPALAGYSQVQYLGTPASTVQVRGSLKVDSLSSTTDTANKIVVRTSAGLFKYYPYWPTASSLPDFSAAARATQSAYPPLSYNSTTGLHSISQATSSTNGYLSSTDWNTFNGKQAALVSGTNLKTINGSSLLGSGDLSVTSVSSLTLNTPAVIYTNPITFTNTSGAWSGTLTLNSQSANTVFAAPNGSSGTPSFRSLAAADIPSLSSGYVVNGTSQQTGNFNISGSGVIGGNLTVPTIYGSTASGGSLTLASTSNATKGKVYFGAAQTSAYDGVNERLGIGTASPSAIFQATGAITASSAIARGVYFNNTLTAAANNDALIGVDINPIFSNGAFTGVSNFALRVKGTFIQEGLTQSGATYRVRYAVGNDGTNPGGYLVQGIEGAAGSGRAVRWIDYAGGGYVKDIMALDVDNGRLGIGTTSPGFKLDVNGDARFGSITTTGTFTAPQTMVYANTTLNTNHFTVLVDASGGAVTITLPAASSCPGRIYVIKKFDGSGNAVTIQPSGTNTIDLYSSRSLTSQAQTRWVQSDGTGNWYIIAAF